jgi:DNA-binding CsgD family transcriptional regulator
MLNKENNKKVSDLLKQGLTEQEIARRANLSVREVINIIDRLSRK